MAPRAARKRPGDQPLLEAAPAAFYVVMAFALIVGLAGVFVSVNYATSTRPLSIVLDIVRDVGVALIVTVVTATSIEMFVNARVRRQIEADVFQATFRKFLPDPIYMQVRDKVLGAGVIRRDWSIDLRVVDPRAEPDVYAELRNLTDERMYIVEARVSYEVENLATTAVDVVVEGGVDLDAPFPELPLPRFTSIVIGKNDDVAGALTDADTRDLLTGKSDTVQLGRELQIRVEGGEMFFHQAVRIPARSKMSADPDEHAQLGVRHRFRRALRVPGIVVMVTPVPADGFRVTASSTGDVTLKVTALHPNMEDCHESPPGEWRFRRGILPWQGLIVRAEPQDSRALGHPVSH